MRSPTLVRAFSTCLYLWAVHGVVTSFDSVGNTTLRLSYALASPQLLCKELMLTLYRAGRAWVGTACLPRRAPPAHEEPQMFHCDDRSTDPKPNCGWMCRFGEMITWKITFFLCLTILRLESRETVARILRLFPHENGLQRYFFCSQLLQ